MQFINNWSRAVTLAPGVTSLALDLPDGEYRLTLADSQFTSTRWEIVGATVAAGTATLVRGLEGTTDQDWPAGSIIYCTVTAGGLGSILAQLASLAASNAQQAQALTDLEGRVAVLEASSESPPNYQLTAANSPFASNVGFEYPGYGSYGSITPPTITLGGVEYSIYMLTTDAAMTGMNLTLELSAPVTATMRIKIAGIMPTEQEWVDVAINDVGVNVHVPYMQSMVAGQTYDIWIEEV